MPIIKFSKIESGKTHGKATGRSGVEKIELTHDSTGFYKNYCKESDISERAMLEVVAARLYQELLPEIEVPVVDLVINDAGVVVGSFSHEAKGYEPLSEEEDWANPLAQKYLLEPKIVKMLIADYFLGNTDSHAGNIGTIEGRYIKIDHDHVFAGILSGATDSEDHLSIVINTEKFTHFPYLPEAPPAWPFVLSGTGARERKNPTSIESFSDGIKTTDNIKTIYRQALANLSFDKIPGALEALKKGYESVPAMATIITKVGAYLEERFSALICVTHDPCVFRSAAAAEAKTTVSAECVTPSQGSLNYSCHAGIAAPFGNNFNVSSNTAFECIAAINS